MKTIIFSIILIFLAQVSFAQETESAGRTENPNEIKTLFGKNRRTGGYGGFSFGYTDIQGNQGLTVGGKGGIIIGQHLTIGLAGKGFSNDYTWEIDANSSSIVCNGGYGGLLIEPIFFPRFPVHLAIPMVFGAGGMGSYSKYYDTVNEYWRTTPYEGSAFLVAEIGAEVEFNLTRFFRMAVGAGYRMTTKHSTVNSVNGIDGLTVDVVFKFGKF